MTKTKRASALNLIVLLAGKYQPLSREQSGICICSPWHQHPVSAGHYNRLCTVGNMETLTSPRGLAAPILVEQLIVMCLFSYAYICVYPAIYYIFACILCIAYILACIVYTLHTIQLGQEQKFMGPSVNKSTTKVSVQLQESVVHRNHKNVSVLIITLQLIFEIVLKGPDS